MARTILCGLLVMCCAVVAHSQYVPGAKDIDKKTPIAIQPPRYWQPTKPTVNMYVGQFKIQSQAADLVYRRPDGSGYQWIDNNTGELVETNGPIVIRWKRQKEATE